MTRTASPYCERHVWDKAADADCPHHPRYEFNGHPSDGEEAVRELLHGFMHGTSDSHLEITRLRHMDGSVLVEGGYNGDPRRRLGGRTSPALRSRRLAARVLLPAAPPAWPVGQSPDVKGCRAFAALPG